jgi:hypothetical protein
MGSEGWKGVSTVEEKSAMAVGRKNMPVGEEGRVAVGRWWGMLVAQKVRGNSSEQEAGRGLEPQTPELKVWGAEPTLATVVRLKRPG